jgi:hypothetical protein
MHTILCGIEEDQKGKKIYIPESICLHLELFHGKLMDVGCEGEKIIIEIHS